MSDLEKPPMEPLNFNKQTSESIIQNTSTKVSQMSRRLRMIEDRYNRTKKKLSFAEHSLINSEQEFNKELKLLTNEITTLKRNFGELKNNLNKLSDEISRTVKKSEFKVFEKYLDLWQPLDFVTNKELLRKLNKKSETNEKKSA